VRYKRLMATKTMSTSINIFRERSTYVSLFNQKGNKTVLVLFNLKLCTSQTISHTQGTERPIAVCTPHRTMVDMHEEYQSLINQGFQGRLGKVNFTDVQPILKENEKVCKN